MIGHDIMHCHCRRCDWLNRNPLARFVGGLAGIGIAGGLSAWIAYAVVRWIATGLPGFNRITMP